MFAVISDIHANLEAFEAVLADIEDRGAERILCLGDIVGYGPDPGPCLSLARQHCAVVLRGNHDMAVLTQALGFNPAAREAVNWTRAQVRPHLLSGWRTRANWRLLKKAPERHEEGDLLFVHGSPRDPVMEYVEEKDLADFGLGAAPKITEIMGLVSGLCFVGHTHTAGVVSPALDFRRPAALPEGWPRDRHPAIINVGSVGQPRDEDARACYVTVSPEAVQYHRVAYDVEKTVAKIRAVPELDQRFAERLPNGT